MYNFGIIRIIYNTSKEMELLTEETTLKGLLIIIIGALIYAIRIVNNEKNEAIKEGRNNLKWYQNFIDSKFIKDE